jgi:hypothetical protein
MIGPEKLPRSFFALSLQTLYPNDPILKPGQGPIAFSFTKDNAERQYQRRCKGHAMPVFATTRECGALFFGGSSKPLSEAARLMIRY